MVGADEAASSLYGRRRARVVRAITISLVALVLGILGYWGAVAIEDRSETARTTEPFEPPVLAGQQATEACAGGFYARRASTIVLLISAHCLNPGDVLLDDEGRRLGVIGERAQLAACPEGRFCSPSDIQPLVLTPEHIPWGHLNMVDMGAGGYRTIEAGTRPLACGDIRVGDRLEIDGREHYRSGTVLAIEPYEHETDTIFPCMVLGDSLVTIGDSGGAVLVRGLPAGIIARQLQGHLGFTPLAEGLENLGLVLCTTPDCELSPERAVQP